MRIRPIIQAAFIAACLGMPLYAGTFWGITGAVHPSVDALKARIDQQGGGVPTEVPATPTPVYSPTSSFTQSPTFSVSPTETVSSTVTPSFTSSPTFSASPTITATPTASDSFTTSPTPSATATATPTVTPSPVVTLVQVIWQNGTTGCWGGNCATGGITIQDSVNWSAHATVSNAMQWTWTTPSGVFNYFQPTFTLQNAQDMSAYANGHLQFDVKLGQPVGNYSSIAVSTYNGGSSMSLNLASVNNTSFTTVSFPLATLGTNGTGLMFTTVTFTSNQVGGNVLIYFNNIEWTSN
jgi:hypothetical protein